MDQKVMTLEEAVKKYVHDCNAVTLGGFCGRNSEAAAYEIVRQKKRGLTILDDSPTSALDILIGAGCVNKLEIAWNSISIFARAMNFRRALEEAVPRTIEVEDYSNLGMGLRFLAGAIGVSFLPLRSMLGSDMPKYNKRIKVIQDPYGGNLIALVPAAEPDVAIIHVQRADSEGNAQIWGHIANDDNKARAAKRTIVCCEEIVPADKILQIPNMTIIPSYCVEAVVEIPYGSHPWSCYGYYCHDILFQKDYVTCSRTYEGFIKWLDTWVFSLEDHKDYVDKVGRERLRELETLEHMINKIPFWRK